MNGMAFLWIVIMIVGLIGMIVCSKKQKTNPAMQSVGFVLFLVVLAGAVMLLREMNVFGGGASDIVNSELTYSASRGNKAGKFLSGIAGGKKVLIIAENGFDKNENSKRIVEAVKAGYGSENVVVDSLAVKGAGEEGAMPIEELMKGKDFDALIAKHKDAGVVISILGLPSDAYKMSFFRNKKGRPVLFLLSSGIGNAKFLVDKIKSGDIAGVIVPNPKADYEVKAPSDPEKAFAIRYILVDQKNIDKNRGLLGE